MCLANGEMKRLFSDNMLQYIFQNNLLKIEYIYGGIEFKITESKNDQHIKFIVNKNAICIQGIEGDKFNYLKIQNCADAMIIVLKEDNNLDLHIIEMKKRSHEKDDEKISKQLLGAYLRVRSLLVPTKYSVSSVKLYAVYSNIAVDVEKELKIASTSSLRTHGKNTRGCLGGKFLLSSKYRIDNEPFNKEYLDVIKISDDIDRIALD